MLIIGIDPGVSGSICFFRDGKILDVIEMPVMNEGKKNKKQVNGAQIYNEITKRIKHATYIIENKEKVAKADILDGFKKYQRITNNKLLYPSNMQRKGKMGYVILDFDIDEDGNTKNIKIQESKCGNMHSPLSNFKSCLGFNSTAINYLKNTKYKPTLFKETAIYTKNAKYKIHFILDGLEIKLNSSKSIYDYKKILKLTKEKRESNSPSLRKLPIFSSSSNLLTSSI